MNPSDAYDYSIKLRNSMPLDRMAGTTDPSLVGNSGGTEEESLQFEIMKIQPKELQFKKNVEE